MHPGGAAANAGIQSGDILLGVNGKDLKPPEHPTFPMGEQGQIEVVDAQDRRVKRTVDVARPKGKKLHFIEPRLLDARPLEDGIGYLKVTMFPDMVGVKVANEISKAIATLGSIDELIVVSCCSNRSVQSSCSGLVDAIRYAAQPGHRRLGDGMVPALS